MNFTPDNIIENIQKIGPWSLYGLAKTAIKYYFKDEYEKLTDEYDTNPAFIMSHLCEDWQEIVIKYQREVGYKPFRRGYVNEY